MTLATMTAVVLYACLLAVTLARPDPETDFDSYLDSFPSDYHNQGGRNARGVGDFFGEVGKAINKEVADIKQPIETVVVNAVSSQCTNVKKIVGVAYEQVKGDDKEPNLNELSLNFITNAYSITFNITQAAVTIPQSPNFNPHQKLYIFIHGFTDDPSKASFKNISTALLSQGKCNVLALDGSYLIKWLYLRSTTYVRFMGEKLGEVLASMVQSKSYVRVQLILNTCNNCMENRNMMTPDQVTVLLLYNLRKVHGGETWRDPGFHGAE
ncbi:hypothetical protein O0L34_g17745 [Tuta absoluta]|nr:hypothetical protein O0L34_g17745 [Tuta absoluta]